MNNFKKIFVFLLIITSLTSCGLSKRVYMTHENKIAISPRGYSANAYHKLDDHKKQDLQRRNRTRAITLIITANALLFVPMFLNQDSDTPQK
jgi:predicted small lipoprotein YifL